MEKLSLLAKLSLIALAVTVVDVFLFWSIIKPKQPVDFDLQETATEMNVNQSVPNLINVNSQQLQNLNSANLKRVIPNNINTNTDINQELPLNVWVTANTDKSIYSSYQTIILKIKITGSQDLSDVDISANGITDRLNRSYFNQKQNIYLSKNIVKEVILSQTLPSCNSCSGLTPGNYSITITADYQDKTLASKNINLTIKQ